MILGSKLLPVILNATRKSKNDELVLLSTRHSLCKTCASQRTIRLRNFLSSTQNGPKNLVCWRICSCNKEYAHMWLHLSNDIRRLKILVWTNSLDPASELETQRSNPSTFGLRLITKIYTLIYSIETAKIMAIAKITAKFCDWQTRPMLKVAAF